ncbi:unnamed protein product, partial [Mesorhabditis spiculigera]
MKVFTVGLDDKEKAKSLDEKLETGSLASSSCSEPPLKPAAQLPVATQKKCRSPFKGCLACIAVVFCVLLAAVVLSELAYARHRDDQFLRLKWAELKQRMIGLDLLRESQLQAQQAAFAAAQKSAQGLNNDQPPEVIDERLAFSKRLENGHDQQPLHQVDNSVESSKEVDGDMRLAFLKAILQKLKAAATDGALPGPVHVSVLEIKKQPLIGETEDDLEEMPQNMADGFGEWAAPSPFGNGDWQEPSEGRQFDRFSWRDRFPQQQQQQQVENSGEGQPWMFNNDGQADAPERPQLRITHHFDKENPMMPGRIVTELYGDDASEFVKSFMNARRPDMMQQPTQQQQRFAAEFGQNFGTNFGLNWERAQGFGQQPQQPHWFQQQQQQQQPQQPQQPMNAWEQWQNQWQQPQMPQPQMPDQAQPADAAQMPWYHNWIQENKPQQPAIVPDAAEAKRIDADEQPARFTDLNEEDQGDDGFEQKEQFNVPADIIADERPEVVEGTKLDEKPHSAEQQSSVVNEQPAAAIDVHPVQEPGSSGKFLPLRDSFDDPPPPAAAAPEKKVAAEPSIPAEAISNDDSFHVDKNSPFFQIDDPSSFVAKA